ncbi:MAG: hypothetical protein ABSB35_14105 [Bryobacteraceae bacterium]|jgi:hypothetical protein
MKLTREEKSRLGKRLTESMEVYQLYLRGCPCDLAAEFLRRTAAARASEQESSEIIGSYRITAKRNARQSGFLADGGNTQPMGK